MSFRDFGPLRKLIYVRAFDWGNAGELNIDSPNVLEKLEMHKCRVCAEIANE